MHEMQKTNVMLNILDKIKLKNADCKIKYLKNITRKSIPCREKKKKSTKKPGQDLTFSCFSTQDKQTAFLKNKKTI